MMAKFKLLKLAPLADYGKFLELQHKLLNDPINYLLVAEHSPTYTLGRRSDPRTDFFHYDTHFTPLNNHSINTTNLTMEETLVGHYKRDIPVYRVKRGGLATYHGPGQLCFYPIVKDLKGLVGPTDFLPAYSDLLQKFLCSTIRKSSSLGDLALVAKDNGVYVNGEKVAFVGFNVTSLQLADPQKLISRHGASLNYTENTVKSGDDDGRGLLSYFEDIVPCGLRDVRIGTIGCPEINQVLEAAKEAFREVFRVELTD